MADGADADDDADGDVVTAVVAIFILLLAHLVHTVPHSSATTTLPRAIDCPLHFNLG